MTKIRDDIVIELRGDSVSWKQIARLFRDAGLVATAESLRRTVRREEERLERFALVPARPASQSGAEGATCSKATHAVNAGRLT